MTRRICFLTFLSLAILLFGCQRRYDDINSEETYAHLIDRTYRSLQELRLHGVTMDRDYAKVIDVYSVTRFRVSGPEIVSFKALDAGSVFRVEQILRCTNCFLTSTIVVSVDILSEDLLPGIPVRLRGLTVESTDGRIELDPDYFRVL